MVLFVFRNRKLICCMLRHYLNFLCELNFIGQQIFHVSPWTRNWTNLYTHETHQPNLTYICGREDLVMLQAAIDITCHDHSITAWVGRPYILLRYLVFCICGSFLFIRWFPYIRDSIIFWGFPHVVVRVPLHIHVVGLLKI